ncbi:MAG: hypothetical protein ACQESA_00945 [Patescibacteria group bacterium]
MQKKRTFYRAVNENGKSHGGFVNNIKVGGVTRAPDWNPDPSIRCGEGLHVVEGHPFEALRWLGWQTSLIFIEVQTYPNPPIVSANEYGKFRCKIVFNAQVLSHGSPEFDQSILTQIAIGTDNADIGKMAVRMSDSNDVLMRIAERGGVGSVRKAALEKLNAQECQEFLGDIAWRERSPHVRQIAVDKIDANKNFHLLKFIAVKEPVWYVRMTAVEKLNPEEHYALLKWVATMDIDINVQLMANYKLHV